MKSRENQGENGKSEPTVKTIREMTVFAQVVFDPWHGQKRHEDIYELNSTD
jgi:hypothetical protein